VQTVKLITTSKTLSETCRQYREIAVSPRGGAQVDADFLDKVRRVSDGLYTGPFKAKFRVDLKATEALLNESIGRSNQLLNSGVDQSPLPMHQRALAQIIPHLGRASEISVVGRAGSLIEVSRSVGLEALPIDIYGDDLEVEIHVQGKDVACDLLTGQAALEFESGATIKIDFNSQMDLEGFYAQVEQFTEQAFLQKRSANARAALLGFKLAQPIHALSVNSSAGERWVSNIASTFFSSSFERNSHWVLFNGKSHLSVPGSAVTTIQVKLER
jgi:hypothetical protein